MKKEYKARIATVVVLLVAVGVVLARKSDWSFVAARTPDEPQDVIYAMFRAARAGDVKGYLASYTGDMERSLRQSLVESTEPGFAKYLKDSNAAVKGVAVSDAQKITDAEAKVRVEYIYQDRNEAQMFYLEKTSTGWKISRADGEERIKALVPYGTPVK